ncbi:MAG: hypothetical protein FJ272_01325, partial [Planctomycetes bacterium]|nr:hypothetical protein [Planctomycetota bacterium]
MTMGGGVANMSALTGFLFAELVVGLSESFRMMLEKQGRAGVALALVWGLCALFTPSHAAAESASYVAVHELATRFSLEHQVDDVTRREVLSNASNRVVLWPGMYSALVNGELLLLDDKAEMRDGKLCVPASFAKALEARLVKPEGAVVEARQRIRIVIDPGHGGRDSGAVSRRGWAEKDINLDISKRLAAGLEAK